VIAEQESGAGARLSETFLADLIRSYDLMPAAAAAAQLEACLHTQVEAAASQRRA